MGRSISVATAGEIYGHWLVLGEGPRHMSPKGRLYRTAICKCTLCGVTQQKVTVSNLQGGLSTKCKDCGQITRMANLSTSLVLAHTVGQQAIQDGLAAHASTN